MRVKLILNLISKYLLHSYLVQINTYVYRFSCMWIELFVLILFSIICFFFLSFCSSFLQSRPKRFDLFDLHCADNDKILRIHVCAERFSSQHAIVDWIHSLIIRSLKHPPHQIDSVFFISRILPLPILDIKR